jgi:hypothetical protein
VSREFPQNTIFLLPHTLTCANGFIPSLSTSGTIPMASGCRGGNARGDLGGFPENQVMERDASHPSPQTHVRTRSHHTQPPQFEQLVAANIRDNSAWFRGNSRRQREPVCPILISRLRQQQEAANPGKYNVSVALVGDGRTTSNLTTTPIYRLRLVQLNDDNDPDGSHNYTHTHMYTHIIHTHTIHTHA